MMCAGAVSSGACGTDYSTQNKAAGSEGGACYGNGTCDDGLTCASNVCVRLDGASSSTDGAVATDGAASEGSPSDSSIQDQLAQDASPSSKDGSKADAGDVGYMFVTSDTFTVSDAFVGAIGADELCRKAASSFGAVPTLAGRKWKAWLSDNGTSALARMTPGMKTSYIRPDQAPIGSPSSFLAGMSLTNAPNISELGTTIDCLAHGAWTGTSADGSAAASTCQAWTSNLSAQKGVYGSCGETNESWTSYSSATCDGPGHIYCFEQN
jgi:hypothetical protein